MTTIDNLKVYQDEELNNLWLKTYQASGGDKVYLSEFCFMAGSNRPVLADKHWAKRAKRIRGKCFHRMAILNSQGFAKQFLADIEFIKEYGPLGEKLDKNK